MEYSAIALLNRVKAGLRDPAPFYKNLVKTPKMTFVEGYPDSTREVQQNASRIVMGKPGDPWNSTRGQ